jgi:hypothetical protein
MGGKNKIAARLLGLAPGLLLAAQPAAAQNDDPFRSAPPPAAPAPVARPRLMPQALPEPEPAPVVVAPQSPTKPNYDGEYEGTETLLPNMPSWCGGPFHRTLTIRSGQFSFTYNRTNFEKVTGVVDSQGAVSGFGTSASGGNKMTGKIQGDEFTGTIGSYICTYSLQMKKKS